MGFISDILNWRFAARMESLIGPLRKASDHFATLAESHVKKSRGGGLYRYTLRFSGSRHIGWREECPYVYWETKFGFVLSIQDASGEIPIAVIGFDICGKQIIIRQLQGIKGMKEQLGFLHWERLLYRAVVLLGREAMFDSVHVCSAHQSEYYPFKDGAFSEGLTYTECVARANRFHLIYEKIPRQCGFTWDELTRRHVLTLSQ